MEGLELLSEFWLSSLMFLGPRMDYNPTPKRALGRLIPDNEMVATQHQKGISEG